MSGMDKKVMTPYLFEMLDEIDDEKTDYVTIMKHCSIGMTSMIIENSFLENDKKYPKPRKEL